MTDKLRWLLEDVQKVYEGKGMVVHPNSCDKLGMEVIKLDNINRLQNEQLEQAKKIIKIFLQLRNGNVLDCCRDKECPCDNPVCENINEQAEKFLKENE